jgi:predicted nucleotide-binding protein
MAGARLPNLRRRVFVAYEHEKIARSETEMARGVQHRMQA